MRKRDITIVLLSIITALLVVYFTVPQPKVVVIEKTINVPSDEQNYKVNIGGKPLNFTITLTGELTANDISQTHKSGKKITLIPIEYNNTRKLFVVDFNLGIPLPTTVGVAKFDITNTTSIVIVNDEISVIDPPSECQMIKGFMNSYLVNCNKTWTLPKVEIKLENGTISIGDNKFNTVKLSLSTQTYYISTTEAEIDINYTMYVLKADPRIIGIGVRPNGDIVIHTSKDIYSAISLHTTHPPFMNEVFVMDWEKVDGVMFGSEMGDKRPIKRGKP